MAVPTNSTQLHNIVCYKPTMITTTGIWEGEDPLKFSLPLFVLQLIVVVVTSRLLTILLRPLRQPRVVAEIIGGVLLGPSVLGTTTWGKKLFPSWSMMVLETMGNVGLIYFLFLIGVELDMSLVRRTGKKSAMIAAVGLAISFVTATITSLYLKPFMASASVEYITFLLFLVAALSISSFPVLARILADLKLLNTELGRLAISVSIINDMCVWAILAVAITLAQNRGTTLSSLLVVLCATVFLAFCIFGLQPAMRWLICQTSEGESISSLHICIILTGVMACGFVTDAIGIHSIFGAFVFGLIIPNGPVRAALIEKLEDFTGSLLLPLYFAISGLQTNFGSIPEMAGGGLALLVITILFAAAGKVIVTVLLASFFHISFQKSASLGLLMNTKGLIEIIILNIGRDQKVVLTDPFLNFHSKLIFYASKSSSSPPPLAPSPSSLTETLAPPPFPAITPTS